MSICSPHPFQYHKVQSFNQTLACPKLGPARHQLVLGLLIIFAMKCFLLQHLYLIHYTLRSKFRNVGVIDERRPTNILDMNECIQDINISQHKMLDRFKEKHQDSPHLNIKSST